MSIPKVITIYRGFPTREKQQFCLFVKSPFINKREKINRLMDQLSLWDEEDEWIWDKHILHRSVFGEVKFNDLQLNNILSDLYKLMEKFLGWKQFEKNTEQKEIFILENLLEAGNINTTSKIIDTKAKNPTSKDADVNYKWNLLADQFYFQQSRKGDNTYLIKSKENLDIHYLGSQLRIWCEMLNRSNVLALEYSGEKFLRFMNYLESNLSDYGSNYTIRIYYPILLWLKNQDDDEWYIGFRDKLFLHIAEFPEQEAKDIISYVQNYCVKRINQGRSVFLKEWLEISKFMLPLNLLNEGKYISQWTYKNIVTVGVRLAEFEWTENFIHEYYQKLSPNERDNAYQYNLAVYYYEKNDIKHAMQLLNKVHFTDPNYYLDARSILLKIYYDHQEFEALISLRDTVKIYLMRDKQLSKGQRILYKNLFNNTIKLYKLRIEKGVFDEQKWQKLFANLQKEVDSTTILANKQWLQAKIDEIKGPAS